MAGSTLPDRSARYLRSSFYEKLVEHVFISEVLQEVWFRHGKTVEVLRSEVDDSGYDVVLECGSVIRHIQLKTSHVGSRAASQKVNIGLADKPSGCVVWMLREEERPTGRMRLHYRFFGGESGRRLPSLERFRLARHTKADSKGVKARRPRIRVIPKGKFEELAGIEELVRRLFGPALGA